MKLIVFDIDGCLSDDSHRRHLLPLKDGDTPHKDYDAYNNLMHLDNPIAHGINALSSVVNRRHSIDGEAPYVLFLTARPVSYRTETNSWLLDKVINKVPMVFSYGIWMRPDGDLRPSPEFKIGMLSEFLDQMLINNGSEIELVAAYDDRNDVLATYANHGITSWRLDRHACVCVHSGPSPLVLKSGDLSLAERGKPALNAHNPEPSKPAASPVGTPELAEIAGIFEQMAGTLRSRAADYGYNAAKVADAMAVFFPNGVTLKTAEDYEAWHLFELIIVKLTRFVNSGLKHKDSIHDMAIYAGFVERLVTAHGIQINK